MSLSFIDDRRVRVGRLEITYDQMARGNDPDELLIMKPASLIARYAEVLEEIAPRTVVELGINRGGSVAAICELAKPERFVALELSPARVPALDAYVASIGGEERVHLEYGVDQGDREAVAEIIRRCFGATPIDVVFDDASHLYLPTRASFDVLFPRLRPGGRYIIEDWAWTHEVSTAVVRSFAQLDEAQRASQATTIAAAVENIEDAAVQEAARRLCEEPTPERLIALGRERSRLDATALTRLGIELMVAVAESPDVVAEVRIVPGWIDVVRGPAPLDDDFRLDELLIDTVGTLSYGRPAEPRGSA